MTESPTPSTDLTTMIQTSLDRATSIDKLTAMIDSKVEAAVKGAIDGALRSWSPFGKDLEKKIQDALQLENLNLPNYNQMISAMVERLVHKNVAEMVEGRLKSDIDALLKIAPKTVKLSEIVDEMRQEHEVDGNYGEVVTCHVELQPEDRPEAWGPTWTIYLDDGNYHKNPQHAKIKMTVRHGLRDRAGPAHEDITTGKISSISDRGTSIANSGKTSGYWSSYTTEPKKVYGLAERLLAYYAAGTIIEIDEEYVNITVGDY